MHAAGRRGEGKNGLQDGKGGEEFSRRGEHVQYKEPSVSCKAPNSSGHSLSDSLPDRPSFQRFPNSFAPPLALQRNFSISKTKDNL